MRALLMLIIVVLASPAQADVLATFCSKCHEVDTFVADGLIVPGKPDESPAYRRVIAGEMPPGEVKRRPGKADVEELRAFIEQLPSARPRIARRVTRQAPWTRWFAVDEADAPALAKLLDSLSWSAKLHPLEVHEGLVRIDLRDYGWSEAQWDAVVAAYPYAVDGDLAIRADWFLAHASQPPLYDVLLGLPATEDALVELLGVEPNGLRAGFTSSGVSVNNRVIERRAARSGAYWRSYDFSSSTGTSDVFAHPLDFVPAGGEIIFTLPNGLQGYMLVNGKGEKLAKAPITIVTDARRPDRAVVNGLSCMGCHAHGIIAKDDQIAAAVPITAVRDLYRPDLQALMKSDAEHFDRAIDTLGAQGRSGEPITAAVARYEADLDLAQAEAELGRAIGTARIGSLGVAGGAVKRDVWEQEFARIVADAGAGIATRATPSGDETRVWVDRKGARWLVAARGVTQAQARTICRLQRLELPKSEVLASAIRDGLGSFAAGTFWSSATELDATNQRRAQVHEARSGKTRRVRTDATLDAICVQQ